MQTPLEICFRHCHEPASLAPCARKHLVQLRDYCDRIISCRIVITCDANNSGDETCHTARIYVALSGRHIKVKRSPELSTRSGNLEGLLERAFAALKERLVDYTRVDTCDLTSHKLRPAPVAAGALTSNCVANRHEH